MSSNSRVSGSDVVAFILFLVIFVMPIICSTIEYHSGVEHGQPDVWYGDGSEEVELGYFNRRIDYNFVSRNVLPTIWGWLDSSYHLWDSDEKSASTPQPENEQLRSAPKVVHASLFGDAIGALIGLIIVVWWLTLMLFFFLLWLSLRGLIAYFFLPAFAIDCFTYVFSQEQLWEGDVGDVITSIIAGLIALVVLLAIYIVNIVPAILLPAVLMMPINFLLTGGGLFGSGSGSFSTGSGSTEPASEVAAVPDSRISSNIPDFYAEDFG